MLTLKYGDCVRGTNFRNAFPVMTIAEYAAKCGFDSVAERDRAINNGHMIAWTINPGSMISDSEMANNMQTRRRHDRNSRAITLAHGETVKIGADLFTVRINGEQFADPIAFKLT